NPHLRKPGCNDVTIPAIVGKLVVLLINQKDYEPGMIKYPVTHLPFCRMCLFRIGLRIGGAELQLS
ncbi:MAG: hypothetical protein ABIF19_14390, partial [Planctomycetota bacterium]